jgi:opacity protein-like surface antigen
MLRRTLAVSFAALALGLSLVAAPAAAQSTGVPVFQAPYRAFANNEVSVFFTDPGRGYSLEGSYRIGLGPHWDGGIRGGFRDGGRGYKTALLAGFDTRYRIVDHTESFPLDGSLTLGLGLSDDGATTGMLPIGFSMGRRFFVEGSSTSLVAYVQPTITPMFADASGTAYTLGFGVDARLTPRLDFRFSAGIGDLDGIGIGVAFLH